ncbi:hypothetical protein MACH10_00630 [Thalassospira tepidiphila]|nr:hypothetical protein MACH10_00630 [Thalassospira tepidiphila]
MLLIVLTLATPSPAHRDILRDGRKLASKICIAISLITVTCRTFGYGRGHHISYEGRYHTFV